MNKDKLVKSAAIATVVTMLVEGMIYVWSMKSLGVRPVFTTWLLFFVASSLSLWTYWSTEKHSVVGNIANVADAFVCAAILTGVIIFEKGNLMGSAFDEYCLIASVVILVFWRVTKHHTLSNLSLQAVMTIAYLPTFFELWHTAVNTEFLPMWILSWVSSIFALVPARVKKDRLGTVYAGRGLVLVSVVIWLILRIHWVVHP